MATGKRGAKGSPGRGRAAPRSTLPNPEPRTYDHPEAKTLLRPDVGTQASFRKKKPPRTYRYDSSLSPALAWDGQNTARELGDWLIGLIEEATRLEAPHDFAEPRRTTLGGRSFEVRGLRDAVAQLKALSRPFLDWAGKYVIGFAIQPVARTLVENCEAVAGIAATYVQATPDLMMGELLKNIRSSQIFSVCGLPEVRLERLKPGKKDDAVRFSVELVGLDAFDPVTMDTEHRDGSDVPAWFLDTDYNGLCFHVCQAFFPRTAAWDDLKRSLRGQFEDSVWDHLAGTKSEPFEAGEHGQVAIKVIDDRGNELLVVRTLREADA